jgi:chitodextrinase
MHMGRTVTIIITTVIVLILLFTIIFFAGFFRPPNLPPEAALAVSATSINVGESIVFSGNDSVDKDGQINRYSWDMGDGTNYTAKYVTHIYMKGGNYTVILIVTDNSGDKALETVVIHVNEWPVPVINISLPAYIHEEVYFFANDSYDLDGYINDYYWNLGDGTNKTGKSVSHTYTAKSSFTVILTVTDNSGAKSARQRLFDVQFRTYQVDWSEDSLEVFDSGGTNLTWEEGDLLGRRSREYLSINIDLLNITKVIFELKWEDNMPDESGGPTEDPVPNDVFIMNVTSPSGDGYEGGPLASELISVEAPGSGELNPYPEQLFILAESNDMVPDLIAANTTSSNGVGDWQVNITLLNAGGASGEEPNADEGNQWRLIVTCFYYIPLITIKED